MNKQYIFPYLLLFVILVVGFLFYQSHSLKRTYQTEVMKGLHQIRVSKNSILTENDTKHLPKPVQKYLAYVGVIGKAKVKNMRITFAGEMKLDPKKDWLQIKSEQYNFFDNPTRIFLIQAKMSGIPIIGLHYYQQGKANMLIKLAGLFTVADAKGPEMDQGETVTFFNDMCLLAPATLIDKRIKWETVDPLTVKAIFDNNGRKVLAVLYFNERGALINFISDDRSMTEAGKSYQRLRWSTPVRKYQKINGLKLPGYAEAIWHSAEGDYCYARFKVKEVEYNCKSFK